MMKFKINADLLPVKGQYFLFNAGTGPLVPFLPTYARQLGFSSVVVGIIYTVLPIIGMLAKPLIGAIADRYQRQKMLFIMFEVLTLVAFFTIQFIPEIPVETKSPVSFDCGFGNSYVKICSNGDINQCTADRIKQEADRLQQEPDQAGYLSCEMECRSFDLCNFWQGPEYCSASTLRKTVKQFSSSSVNGSLDFIATIPLNRTLIIESCLYFEISHLKLYPNGEEFIPSCKNETSVICNARCNSSAVNNLITREKEHDGVTGFYQFWIFFLLMILSWVGMAVIVSVGDAICFGMLGDQPSRFGQQRLWGAVGWGSFSILAGILVDEFSKGQDKKDYTVVFYLLLVMLALDILVSSRLKYTQTKLSPSIIRDVGRLLCDLRIVVFLMWTIVVGLCTAMVWQYLFWHIEDLAVSYSCDMQQWVKTLQGLINGVQSFGGELPFFFLSGHILRKIGHIHAMSLVLLAFGVRFVLYYFLVNPWWCLPIELLQGFTFGIFYSTMASYASVVSPPGTEATVQGLVGASFEGIGVSVGSLIGGILIDQYGGAVTFLVFGLGALICFVLHVIIQFWLSGKPQSVTENGDFDSMARYATPSEAILMLSEQQLLTT